MTKAEALKEIERMRGLFKTLQKVTGQAMHWPIEYEAFVQRVAKEGLKDGDNT